jgi:hypothetical protein
MNICILREMAAAGFLRNDLEILCVVRGRRFLENLDGLDLSSKEYRQFSAVLRTSGEILFNEEVYRFPSRAARAVRRIIEGRRDWPSEKTGGWPYWHFRDQRTGGWVPLQRLRDIFRENAIVVRTKARRVNHA